MAVDLDLIEQGIKPLPATPAELAAMAELGPADYEIYSEMLSIICQEGKDIMTKMGISAMLHSGDSVAAIYTPAGDLVTAILGTYLHCVTGQIPIKFILKYWKDNPTVGVRPGDVFYCNEAIYGGIHNPDQFAVVPAFLDGELIAWSVVGAHQAETGGSEPGGEITTARSRHDEGMKLTPIKIGERYQLRDDLLKMMENFISRAPRMQVTDVRARVSGADRVRMRLEDLAAKRGAGFLSGLFRKMITETAEGARSRIRAWNDGVYRHTVFLDTTGAEAGLIRVCLALVKQGDHVTIDLTGTSPEHEGSFQALAASTRAHCAVNLYSFPFHDFPVSAGMLEPVDFVIPHGTILDPDTEAAISCSPLAASAVFPLLAVTFSKMMFDSDQRSQVCGFASSNSSAPMISAVNQHGVRITDFMGYPLNAWGLSARSDSDGVDVFGFPHCPWGKQPDVEDTESEFPVLHLYQKMLPNTCGFGRWRGGAGAAIGYVTHHVPYVIWTSTQKEAKLPTHAGLFGGYAETVVPGIRVTGTDVVAALATGDPDIPADDIELITNNTLGGELHLEHQTRPATVLYRGELLCASTQGGGGYGDVLEREPERVLADLRGGVITRWVAEHVYCVAITGDGLAVDGEQTERLRAAERARRLARGQSWEDFHREWDQLEPPADALKYYGSWPDARKNREVIRILRPPVDARSRVRQFLARGTADRAPFPVMATEYTARLAQCDPADLLADPGLFVRSFTESVAVLGLEAVLIEVPAARALPVAVGGDPAACGFAVLREDLHRLRATLRDQIAIVALLPGPMTLAGALGVAATPESMDDLVTELIRLQEYLGPADLDALALLERADVADPDVPGLAGAAAAFWNVARYYSLPSLLIAANGTARLAAAGPTAVAAWAGVTAAELLAAGAVAAGQPPSSLPAPPPPAPLPPGGFYLTPGEIPPDWPVDAVRSLVRQLSR